MARAISCKATLLKMAKCSLSSSCNGIVRVNFRVTFHSALHGDSKVEGNINESRCEGHQLLKQAWSIHQAFTCMSSKAALSAPRFSTYWCLEALGPIPWVLVAGREVKEVKHELIWMERHYAASKATTIKEGRDDFDDFLALMVDVTFDLSNLAFIVEPMQASALQISPTWRGLAPSTLQPEDITHRLVDNLFVDVAEQASSW